MPYEIRNQISERSKHSKALHSRQRHDRVRGMGRCLRTKALALVCQEGGEEGMGNRGR